MLPGVSELWDELRQSGIKIAIASASKNAKTVIEKLGITDRVDAIADGYSVAHDGFKLTGTIAIVTHDATVAAQTQRVIHLQDGVVVERGKFYKPCRKSPQSFRLLREFSPSFET